MKSLFRVLVACIICLGLSAPVFASENISDTSLTSSQASMYLKTLMEHLLNNYVGKELTVEELYDAAARGMAEPLDDFSQYLSAEEYELVYKSLSGNFKGIGIQFSVRLDGSLEVVKVIADSPAMTAGIMPGDIILKVGNIEVGGYSSEDLAKLIADAPEVLSVEVFRDGIARRFSMQKAEVHMDTVEYKVLENNIGYIIISQIGEYTAKEMLTAISEFQTRGISSLILDLRGNPGGYKDVIDQISRMFVPEGVIYSTVDVAGRNVVYNSSLKTPPFANVVILVDADTASASELFTAAMQDAKAAVVIGSRTFGKGIIQSFIELPMGDMIKYTSMEYLRRSGQHLHEVGITPDILIDKPEMLGDEMLLINNDGTGIGVKNCKELLKYIGYEVGELDNHYNEKTKVAITDIQKRAGLNSTGMFDTQTIMAVNTAYNIYLRENDAELARAIELLLAKAAA